MSQSTRSKKRARSPSEDDATSKPPKKRIMSASASSAPNSNASTTDITIQPQIFDTMRCPPPVDFGMSPMDMDSLSLPMMDNQFGFSQLEQQLALPLPFYLDQLPAWDASASTTDLSANLSDEASASLYLDELLEGMDLSSLADEISASVPAMVSSSSSASKSTDTTPPSTDQVSKQQTDQLSEQGSLWMPNTFFNEDMRFDMNMPTTDVTRSNNQAQPPSMPPALESIEDTGKGNKANQVLIESWKKWTTSPFPTSYIDPAKERDLLKQNSQAFAEFAQRRAILYHSYLRSRSELLVVPTVTGSPDEINVILAQIEIDAKIQEKACFNSYWETTFGPISTNKKNKSKGSKGDRVARRTKRPKFNEYDVRVLEDWFETNRANPYPTGKQQHRMAEITGLSKYQVSRWFCNARIRRSRD